MSREQREYDIILMNFLYQQRTMLVSKNEKETGNS